MASMVRQSKFRHVYGDPDRHGSYDGISVKTTGDSLRCAVNLKFIAIIIDEPYGAFHVLPVNKPDKELSTRLEDVYPPVDGHRSHVLDIQWNPFNDNMIASASEDTTIKVWYIPDGGPSSKIVDPLWSLERHQKSVGVIRWHPSANNILVSAGNDGLVIIWNTKTGEVLTEIQAHPDVLFSCEWNYNGSKLVTTGDDGMIRIIDPRSGDVINEGEGHVGFKAQRAIWLRDGHIFTTGFSRQFRTPVRQFALRNGAKIIDPIISIDVDDGPNVLNPIYDSDLSMIYLIGKNDSAIRFYEIDMQQTPYVNYIGNYASYDGLAGLGIMPKRGLDQALNEINRFYKVHKRGLVEPLKMICPRKETYNADLFPDALSGQPALSADEWFVEKLDKNPLLKSINGGYQSQPTEELQVAEEEAIVSDKTPSNEITSEAGDGASGAATTDAELSTIALKNAVETLERSLVVLDKRIEALEATCELLASKSE